MPCFISPYHDSDFTADGEPKKPHYHVLFNFDGPKSVVQVREIIEKFNGVGVENVHSLRSYARYLCHLDDYEKTKYNLDKVVSIGGLDYLDTINTALDKYTCIREMIIFCKDNEITNFSELFLYSSFHKFEWFKILCDCGAVAMREYLKGLRESSDYKPSKIKFLCDDVSSDVSSAMDSAVKG